MGSTVRSESLCHHAPEIIEVRGTEPTGTTVAAAVYEWVDAVGHRRDTLTVHKWKSGRTFWVKGVSARCVTGLRTLPERLGWRFGLRLAVNSVTLRCLDSILPASHECADRRVNTMQLETKFLRLRTPVTLGSRFGDWHVTWLGGWCRYRLYYLVMVVKIQPLHTRQRRTTAGQ